MLDEEKLNEQRWLALQLKIFEEKIKTAFIFFRRSRIEPILIKGWAAARHYPDKKQRSYADIDLCVAPEAYARAEKLLGAEEGRRLGVDLHCGLRHLDTLEWPDLFENSRLIRIDDVDVRVLRPEDHLRVLCVHWLNDGGAHKERLLDIVYAIENRPVDFDWERCLGAVSPRRREWIIKTIAVARKYKGLDVEGLPFAGETEHLPAWLVRALEREWASGVRLRPLQTCLGDRRELWRQIRKRFPPNPIQATVETDGEFDDRPRLFYQIKDVFFRLRPSLRRVAAVIGYSAVKDVRRIEREK